MYVHVRVTLPKFICHPSSVTRSNESPTARKLTNIFKIIQISCSFFVRFGQICRISAPNGALTLRVLSSYEATLLFSIAKIINFCDKSKFFGRKMR